MFWVLQSYFIEIIFHHKRGDELIFSWQIKIFYYNLLNYNQLDYFRIKKSLMMKKLFNYIKEVTLPNI